MASLNRVAERDELPPEYEICPEYERCPVYERYPIEPPVISTEPKITYPSRNLCSRCLIGCASCYVKTCDVCCLDKECGEILKVCCGVGILVGSIVTLCIIKPC